MKAIVYDARTKQSSAFTEEKFDISRKNWKIIGISDDKCYTLLDGSPATQWYQNNGNKLPVDLVIDLGRTENVSGFKYLPDQNWWASGIIDNYIFFVSQDGVNWKKVDEGEFANIKNNPLMQSKTFAPEKARYIKLQAIRNTQNDDRVGYAEIDIITQ